MRLPLPRGPVTAALFDELTRPAHPLPAEPAGRLATRRGPAAAALTDEDLQLALHVCYELHYHGFDEVDDGWEWEPSLLALRRAGERRLELALGAVIPAPPAVGGPDELPRALADLVSAADAGGPAAAGPAGGRAGGSLATFLHRAATRGQFSEFVVHRSIYHLKEADPHTWAIPRVRGPAKAALVERQSE